MQALVHFFQENMIAFYCMTSVLGACVGSFLNVVIYRYPKMLARSWREQCYEYLAQQPPESDQTAQPAVFNLLWPGSHCPHCQASVKWYDNLPVISFVLLRARCRHCQHAISIRYVMVELLTALLTLAVAYYFGTTLQALFAALFVWVLIALSVIDLNEQILPDDLTLGLLWVGLLVNCFAVYVPIEDAVLGAVAGYLSLWLVAGLFKLLSKREGMGQGDFKLFACLGAWLGWQLLPLIILIASISGAVLGILYLLISRQSRSTPIPFGPYLAIAGVIAFIWGDLLMATYY